MKPIEQSHLGKKTEYDPHYNPDLLFPIPRKSKRDEIGVTEPLPFYGQDLWNHYEVSWLNEKGKPVVALAEICYDCSTPCLIESKSMKLYFNSLNNTAFKNADAVQRIVKKDLESRLGGKAHVKIIPLDTLQGPLPLFVNLEGSCLDTLDIECTDYHVNTSFLKTFDDIVEEILTSNLLKSNCLVTHQPDWGSVLIHYRGKKMDPAGLLRYIISFRNHNEFHEQCIERIFMDITRYCQPTFLTVYGRYTRRGGLDINPLRSSLPLTDITPVNRRLLRQ